jgi:hypothetical protein
VSRSMGGLIDGERTVAAAGGGGGGRDELGFGEGMSLGHGEIKRKKIASPGRGYEAVGASVFDFDPAGA